MATLSRASADINTGAAIYLNGTGGNWASAAAGGDVVACDEDTVIYVANTHSSASRTVTIAKAVSTYRPGDGRFGNVTVANLSITVAAGTVKAIRVGTDIYVNTNGQATLTYSNTGADLHVMAVRHSG